MAIRKTKSGYTVDITKRGVGRFRATYDTQEEAALKEAAAKAALAEGKPPAVIEAILGNKGLPKQTIKTGPSLKDAYDIAERAWRRTKDYKNTIDRAHQVCEALGWDIPLDSIDYSKLDYLIEYFRNKGNGPATINRKLTILGRMLNLAVRHGLLKQALRIEKLKEPEKKLIYFTKEQIQEFFEILDNSHYAYARPYFRFLLFTGARRNEALNARKEDYNHATGSITFKNTKNGKPRSVPLVDELKEYVEYAQPGLLFPEMTKYKVRGAFEYVREKMGLPKEYTVHTFRHTCATRLVQAGVHITDVKEWLGHSSIQTTMIYIQFSPDHLRNAVKALESI